MTDPRRYSATYTFTGRGWIVQFLYPDISTFGRTLAASKRHARSLLAVHLEVDGLDKARVEIDEAVLLPIGVDAEVDHLVRMREQADAIRNELASATRRAAGELRRAGFSTRDVGALLGISGARVSQIERETITTG